MKRKLKLKYWVKALLIAIPIIVLFMMILNKIDEGFVETCMKQSYSKTYCERSK